MNEFLEKLIVVVGRGSGKTAGVLQMAQDTDLIKRAYENEGIILTYALKRADSIRQLAKVMLPKGKTIRVYIASEWLRGQKYARCHGKLFIDNEQKVLQQLFVCDEVVTMSQELEDIRR